MTQVTIEKTSKYLIVKIPLTSMRNGKAELTPASRKAVDSAINEGIRNIEDGRFIGPFKNIKEFNKAIR